jgi:hypothetical protein
MQDATNPVFAQMVDGWIAEASRAGVRTLDELVTRLPGVYPSVVLERLQILSQAGRCTGLRPVHLGGEAANAANGGWPQLPTPHPLDFTWWFDKASAVQLVNTVVGCSQPKDLIVLLGTPTLFLTCISAEVDRKVVLLDADRLAVRSLRSCPINYQVIHCDLLNDELPRLAAQVIIVDPPWYQEELKHFLWAARQHCDADATVLLSCPPAGTRPGSEAEVARIFEWAATLGLELVEFKRDSLIYLSPVFEQNALRAKGVPSLTTNWRRGDLARFECVGARSVTRPLRPARCTWWEETIRGVRFRIRKQPQVDWADPTLITLVEDDILPSVSRREPIREHVDVWTSGNRVFACEGRLVLREILRAMGIHADPREVIMRSLRRSLSSSEEELIGAASSHLQEVIRQEQADVVQWRI